MCVSDDLLYSAHPWAPPLRGQLHCVQLFKFAPGEFVTWVAAARLFPHVQAGLNFKLK